MSNDFLPYDVYQFVLKHIDSVAHLEGLLLLRSDPNTVWSVEALAKRLYISDRQTSELLLRLHGDGFVIRTSNKPPLYQYRPQPFALREMMDRVAETYSRYLVPVTNLIHSKATSRVQEFADAFKLTKEE